MTDSEKIDFLARRMPEAQNCKPRPLLTSLYLSPSLRARRRSGKTSRPCSLLRPNERVLRLGVMDAMSRVEVRKRVTEEVT